MLVRGASVRTAIRSNLREAAVGRKVPTRGDLKESVARGEERNEYAMLSGANTIWSTQVVFAFIFKKKRP